jgi:hypothetical protein
LERHGPNGLGCPRRRGAALLVVAVTSGYWPTFPERKYVVAEIATLKTAPTGALPAAETAPTPSAPQLTVNPPSPDNQSPLVDAITPLVAASAPMAADQSPTVISHLPPIAEQVPIAVPSAEVPQVPATEKSVAALHDDKVFVVRFDSKLPGLTPTGLRALDAALRANDAGLNVSIAIKGCDSGDSPANGVDCDQLIRWLKRILINSGVSHPAKLIVNSYR